MQIQDQCQVLIQKQIHETMHCIALKRNLFDSKSFTSTTLLRTPATTPLLDWIDQGIADGVSRKYLSYFTVAIYLTEDSPTDIVEAYTFRINYTGEAGPPIDTLSEALDKLAQLPETKYLTIKLFFCSNAPANYVPKGFKLAEGHDFKYDGPRVSVSSNSTKCVGFSEIYTSKEILKQESIDENKKTTLFYSDSFMSQDTHPNSLKSQNNDIKFHTVGIEKNKPTQEKSQKDTFQETKSSLLQESDKRDVSNMKKDDDSSECNPKIRCICKTVEKTFELLYCDTCENWLHTVCCGYFSNKDKRIPIGEYQCQFCRNDISKNANEISIIRKMLSVIYNEGIKSKKWLGERVGLSQFKSISFINKLIDEGFIVYDRKGKSERLQVVKDSSVKKKLKEYFRIRRAGKSALPISDLRCRN